MPPDLPPSTLLQGLGFRASKYPSSVMGRTWKRAPVGVLVGFGASKHGWLCRLSTTAGACEVKSCRLLQLALLPGSCVDHVITSGMQHVGGELARTQRRKLPRREKAWQGQPHWLESHRPAAIKLNPGTTPTRQCQQSCCLWSSNSSAGKPQECRTSLLNS